MNSISVGIFQVASLLAIIVKGDQEISGYYGCLGCQQTPALGGLLIQTGDVLMMDMSEANRPNAYGSYDVVAKTGSLTFDDDPSVGPFTFDSVNGIINFSNGAKWIKHDIVGTYIGGAIISRTGINNDISIDMSIANRPTATGTYNDPVFPNEYGVGTVTFPDDKTYTAYFYGDEKRIYWDGARCGNHHIWQQEDL